MIWRSDDQQETYCDIGRYAGRWRISGHIYGTRAEIDALLASRSNELAVVPDPGDGPGPGGYISGGMRNRSDSRLRPVEGDSNGEDQRLRSARSSALPLRPSRVAPVVGDDVRRPDLEPVRQPADRVLVAHTWDRLVQAERSRTARLSARTRPPVSAGGLT